MKKGDNKYFEEIEKFCKDNDFTMSEYGEQLVNGEYFIVCRSNTKDITVSFILDGGLSNGKNIYECIYSDLK